MKKEEILMELSELLIQYGQTKAKGYPDTILSLGEPYWKEDAKRKFEALQKAMLCVNMHMK